MALNKKIDTLKTNIDKHMANLLILADEERWGMFRHTLNKLHSRSDALERAEAEEAEYATFIPWSARLNPAFTKSLKATHLLNSDLICIVIFHNNETDTMDRSCIASKHELYPTDYPTGALFKLVFEKEDCKQYVVSSYDVEEKGVLFIQVENIA